MELIKNWASTLCVVIVFISVATMILPYKNGLNSYVKFALSLVLLATMILPIIKFLTLDDSIENFNISDYLNNESNVVSLENEENQFYSNDLLLESLEKTLSNTLKSRYDKKDFQVDIQGTIDLNSVEVKLSSIKIGIKDEQKVKKVGKVDKVTIGENIETNNEPEEDSFIGELKEFVSQELKISKEKIKINYV